MSDNIANRDQNRITVLMADSSLVGGSPLRLKAIPLTALNALAVALVDATGAQITSFGGGVQYTEGDTDATITGTALMWEDASDTLRSVSAAKPLPVNLVAGTITGADGAILDGVSSSIKATVFDYTNSNPLAVVLRDANGDYVSVGGGTQYADGALRETAIGTLAMGDDGTNIQSVHVDSSGDLQIDVLTMPSVAVTGTFWQATQPVSGTITANAGTNLNTSLLALEAGGNLASTVTSLQLIDDIIYTSGDALNKVAGIAAQFDDTTPGAITENKMAPLRMSSRRELYITLRDAAGNERGLNIDTNGALAITAAALPLPSGAATSALQTQPGVDIGDITINNAAGASAVNIQDGGNTITVDGTVSANATLAAETTKVIGTINIASSQTVGLVAGSAAIGKLAANSGVDIGDVDVTSLPAITIAATQTLANVTTLGTITNVVHVDDNSASLTVDIGTALPAGNNAIGKLAANSGVDIGDVDITSIVPGVGATNLGKAIDTALGATDTGVLALGVRDDTLNIRSGTENDVEPLHTDASGALWTDPQGNVAHDAADAGNPIKVGAHAIASPKGLTLVATNDRTDLYADLDGLQIVKNNTSGADLISERVSNTDGASTAFTNFSAIANVYNYVTAYHVFRTDAGTTPIYVDFRNGTAGAILWTAVIPPNGGSNSPAYVSPGLFKTSANTALAFDLSAATTTAYISVSGYQSKV